MFASSRDIVHDQRVRGRKSVLSTSPNAPSPPVLSNDNKYYALGGTIPCYTRKKKQRFRKGRPVNPSTYKLMVSFFLQNILNAKKKERRNKLSYE